MKAAETAQVRVETHGRVPNGSAELAEAKVGSLLRAAAEPVLSARVTLAVAADPAVARPAVAQATIDMNGRVLRAQAAGQTMRAAIEQMADRLRVRLGRAARNWAALRGTIPWPARRMAAPGHPGPPAPVLPQARRPAGGHQPRQLRGPAGDPGRGDRRAGPAGLRLPPVHRAVDRAGQRDLPDRGGYRLAMAHPKPGRLGPLPGSVTVSQLSAPRLSVREAAERLDAAGQPFTFFTDADTGRGCVVYHRYDGHYGLLVPSGTRR